MITCEVSQKNNAFEQALLLYKKETFPQTKLLTDIMEYAKSHYAYCSPNYIILAKIVEDRSWFIYLAVGKEHLTKFFELAPFELPFIGFARPTHGREDVRWYPWKNLYDHCHKKH